MNRHPLSFGCLLLFCGLALGCTGCSGLRSLPIKEPTTNFREIGVQSVTPDGIAIGFDVNVRNPNNFYLPVTAAKYDLTVGGTKVIQGESRPSDALPPFGSMPVTVLVYPTYRQLLAAQDAIAEGGDEVPFEVNGSLEMVASASSNIPFPWPNRRVTVPLHFAGTLRMREVIREAMNNPTILRSPDAREFLEGVTDQVSANAGSTGNAGNTGNTGNTRRGS
jgi:LEA14-like dessication related protein